MNPHHDVILEEIKKLTPSAGANENFDLPKYLGHSHKQYHLITAQKRTIAKNWAKAHPNLPPNKIIVFLDSLYQGESYEEKAIAGLLLGYLPELRQRLDLAYLEKWLKLLEGWAEIDATCQGNFDSHDLLSRWNEWKKFLTKLGKSKNINHRRASLVFLTKSVRESDDPRLAKLAFANINRTQPEEEVLITKAISWLLRELIKHHRNSVEKYLQENEISLPKIALRETRKKLTTGKKWSPTGRARGT